MEQKHPVGYWVNQLTDEQIEELTKLILTDNEKFSKMEDPKRKETCIKVKYHYNKTNAYLHCRESELTITDFELTGKIHSDSKFYNFMIDCLGSEYAEELANYLEEKIQTLNQDLTKVRALIKFQENLKADLQNENTL